LRLLGFRGAAVFVLALVLLCCASSGLRTAPADAAAPPTRQRFLEMWARHQREVSGVQHDDFPNAFLPPFVRSATIP